MQSIDLNKTYACEKNNDLVSEKNKLDIQYNKLIQRRLILMML